MPTAEDAHPDGAAQLLAAMPGLPVPAGDGGLPFALSPERKKNAKGAALCMAAGCSKNSQANSKVPSVSTLGGFCRGHHNQVLISTGLTPSWTCTCGNKVAESSDRCGKCHRWKAGKQPPASKKGEGGTPKKRAAKKANKSPGGTARMATLAAPTEIAISTERKTNDKGRPLCKVVGCEKLDQARNDGFCRMHFNMCSDKAAANGGEAGDVKNLVGNGEDWTCGCGNVMSSRNKRCGKCNKWKGGKRDPYTVAPKKKAEGTTAPPKKKAAKKEPPMPPLEAAAVEVVAQEGDWTCNCGKLVAAPKSRCGSCHAWRGGKRKGGWKIDPNKKSKRAAAAAGIDWSADWQCCGALIPAKKTRCGKCNGWRGGTRVPKAERLSLGGEGGAMPALPEMAVPAPVAHEEEGVGETTFI